MPAGGAGDLHAVNLTVSSQPTVAEGGIFYGEVVLVGPPLWWVYSSSFFKTGR